MKGLFSLRNISRERSERGQRASFPFSGQRDAPFFFLHRCDRPVAVPVFLSAAEKLSVNARPTFLRPPIRPWPRTAPRSPRKTPADDSRDRALSRRGDSSGASGLSRKVAEWLSSVSARSPRRWPSSETSAVVIDRPSEQRQPFKAALVSFGELLTERLDSAFRSQTSPIFDFLALGVSRPPASGPSRVPWSREEKRRASVSLGRTTGRASFSGGAAVAALGLPGRAALHRAQCETESRPERSPSASLPPVSRVDSAQSSNERHSVGAVMSS